MQNMSIELKGLIYAIGTVAVLMAVIFGISAAVVKSGGSATATSAPNAARALPHGALQPTHAPDSSSAGQLVAGHNAYMTSCASCHGKNAQGVIGPDLRHLDISDAQVAATIKNGVKGKMPAFGSE